MFGKYTLAKYFKKLDKNLMTDGQIKHFESMTTGFIPFGDPIDFIFDPGISSASQLVFRRGNAICKFSGKTFEIHDPDSGKQKIIEMENMPDKPLVYPDGFNP